MGREFAKILLRFAYDCRCICCRGTCCHNSACPAVRLPDMIVICVKTAQHNTSSYLSHHLLTTSFRFSKTNAVAKFRLRHPQWGSDVSSILARVRKTGSNGDAMTLHVSTLYTVSGKKSASIYFAPFYLWRRWS